MAWSNVGPFTIVEPGQSVTWNYSWANGQDMGLQLAGPNTTADPANLGTAVTSNQGKQVNGFNNVTYTVTITNIASREDGGVRHNLQGGGVE